MLSRLVRSRLGLAGASILITALVSGGIAWAVSPVSSGGTINGCYNPVTGGVQLKVTALCPATGNSDPLAWNIPGAKGATGARGAESTAVEDVTWNASVPGSTGTATTHTGFGSGSTIEALSATLSGNFSSCTGGYGATVAVQGSGTNLASWSGLAGGSNITNLAADALTTDIVTGTTKPLVATVNCIAGTRPTATLSITLRWSHPDPTHTLP